MAEADVHTNALDTEIKDTDCNDFDETILNTIVKIRTDKQRPDDESILKYMEKEEKLIGLNLNLIQDKTLSMIERKKITNKPRSGKASYHINDESPSTISEFRDSDDPPIINIYDTPILLTKTYESENSKYEQIYTEFLDFKKFAFDEISNIKSSVVYRNEKDNNSSSEKEYLKKENEYLEKANKELREMVSDLIKQNINSRQNLSTETVQGFVDLWPSGLRCRTRIQRL